ncbi:MAG: PDZ domain-containing protein [Clostridia bacterium]|nr:PDZ domain-containing protein [Clostridia bacterium]
MKGKGWKWLIVLALVATVALAAGCYQTPQGDLSQYDMLKQVVGIIEEQYGGLYDVDAADVILSQALVDSLDKFSYLSDGAYTQASNANIGFTTTRTIYNEYFVISIAPGMPADDTFEDGFHLERGDEIYAINGNRIRGLGSSYWSAYSAGGVGTQVTLTIYRDGVLMGDYTYTKVEQVIPRVYYVKDVYADGSEIGYIKLTSFALYQTPDGKVLSPVTEFDAAMAQFHEDDQKGLVLDLRGNGGGSVSVLGNIASYFVPHEGTEGIPVLELEYAKTGEIYVQKAAGHDYVDVPITLLVDGNTASAAEALVGACRAYNPHATVIGSDTYGKGVFQSTGIKVKDHTKESETTFEDTYYLVLVAGYYYIVDPSVEGGRYNIHEHPLSPDIPATTETYGALTDDAEMIAAQAWLAEQLQPEAEELE